MIDESALAEPLLKAFLGNDEMTREKAMQIPALAGAVNEIAETVANVPIKLYKRGKKRVEEVKGDWRVHLLNEDTGDTLDANMMKQALVKDYLLDGSGNIYVDWVGNEIRSLRYVQSNHVSYASNADVIFKEYAVLVQGKRYFPEQFVRVLRGTRDGMRGVGIVEENSKILSVSYNSLKYEEGLVKTGGNKKGFVKSAKNLTQDAIDKLKAAWRKLYSNNTENVIILNNGLEFQEASNTSVEMQLNENKQTNAKEIRTILGVPDDVGTENGDKAFIKYCVNMFLGAFMVALNKSVLLESEKEEYFFAADTYELTKGDADKRFGAYKEAIETGWMQVDEVREKENMEPLGLEFIKLGLQDVLYDPKTKVVYTPNTNQSNKLGGEKEGQELKLEQMGTEKKSSLTDTSTLPTETAGQSQTEKEDTLSNE